MSIRGKMILLICLLVSTVAISIGLVSLVQSTAAMEEQVEQLIPVQQPILPGLFVLCWMCM